LGYYCVNHSEDVVVIGEWHCFVNGAVCGPYQEEQIAEMLRSGHISGDTLVWSGDPGNVERGWIKVAETSITASCPEEIKFPPRNDAMTEDESSASIAPPCARRIQSASGSWLRRILPIGFVISLFAAIIISGVFAYNRHVKRHDRIAELERERANLEMFMEIGGNDGADDALDKSFIDNLTLGIVDNAISGKYSALVTIGVHREEGNEAPALFAVSMQRESLMLNQVTVTADGEERLFLAPPERTGTGIGLDGTMIDISKSLPFFKKLVSADHVSIKLNGLGGSVKIDFGEEEKLAAGRAIMLYEIYRELESLGAHRGIAE
jgi:hypothetical protein